MLNPRLYFQRTNGLKSPLWILKSNETSHCDSGVIAWVGAPPRPGRRRPGLSRVTVRRTNPNHNANALFPSAPSWIWGVSRG